ncbi:MAG TPA: hypothetical protein VHN14_24090 [Kofleriaceae bacterium]|jgi:hypothetical protein|nr:hypothetical protein [Kofleriaceae bacterium]
MQHGGRLRSAGVAVLLALGLLFACRQISLHGGYAPHANYRAQVDALLDGRLALTTAPEGLRHDLAWTPHGVQQVWGLGAPLWQLPFEAFGRLIGVSPFPDRIALAAWLAVMLVVLIRAFAPRAASPGALPGGQPEIRAAQPEPRPDDPRTGRGRVRAIDARLSQIGVVLLTALLPGLVSVLRGRIGVYEEAAIYAYGAAMILLGGLVAVYRAPTTARYLVLLGFAGLTGLFRPTVWFYGLATALVASAMLVRQRGQNATRAIALGGALFVAGGGLLYATNAQRFGRGSEFGHRLNVHSLPGNIVATRFSYPFERASTIEAARELFGSLFDGPERRSKRGFYQTGLHRGQSPLPRWREYYFTTFSWPYMPVLLAGLVLGALAWRRRGDRLARGLGAWAVLGGAPLFVFYLHSPSVSSRYQLDLAPALAALLVIAWRACVARWPRRGFAALVVLWAGAVATSKYARPKGISDPIDRGQAAITTYEITRAAAYDRALPPAYDRADPLLPTWIDVAQSYVRCSDALGARIACDAPAMPGDVVLRGHQAGPWFVDHYVIPDQLPEPVCRPAADDGDPARSCTPAPGLLDDPAAVYDGTWLAPPPLYLNGFGWDLATGRVPPATVFYVDDPAYIALDVTGPVDTDWDHAVRVAIGLDHLRLVAAAGTAGGARLWFAGSRHPGLQVVFVAFGPDREIDQPRSSFGLAAIRWRD